MCVCARALMQQEILQAVGQGRVHRAREGRLRLSAYLSKPNDPRHDRTNGAFTHEYILAFQMIVAYSYNNNQTLFSILS